MVVGVGSFVDSSCIWFVSFHISYEHTVYLCSCDTQMKSAGIIPVIYEDDENGVVKTRILMLRVGSYWDFPKGQVEDGETELAAAIRECYEETRIKDLLIWQDKFYETEKYSKKKKVSRYYIAVTGTKKVELPISEELGKPEHEEYRWVTEEETKGLSLHSRIAKVVKWAFETIGKVRSS